MLHAIKNTDIIKLHSRPQRVHRGLLFVPGSELTASGHGGAAVVGLVHLHLPGVLDAVRAGDHAAGRCGETMTLQNGGVMQARPATASALRFTWSW